MAYYEDPAPADTPTTEADFETKGKDFVTQLKGPPSGALSSKRGDSDGGPVKDFAVWFSDLQDTLSASPAWSDTHEQAHRLLYRYAMWKVGTQWGMSPVAANVEFLFRFLGKAEENQPSISKMNSQIAKRGGVLMTTSNTFFGAPGASNWCAVASSMPIWKVLEKKSMKLQDDGDPQGIWAQRAGIQITPSSTKSPTLETVDIKSGDYIRVVGMRSPLSGHIATAIRADPPSGMPSTIWYVSGNAGRFGGGAVRIDSVQREKPPEEYSYLSASSLGNNRDKLKTEIKTQQKHIAALANSSYYNPNELRSLEEANAEYKLAKELRNNGIQAAKDKIAKCEAGIATINKNLMLEAAKVRPDKKIDNEVQAEAALKPQTEGHAWLTMVAQTGQMGLNDLKPPSDPSMKSWMARWRATAMLGKSS